MNGEEELVTRAVDGETAALEEVVQLLQDPLYRLALRMVWRPADAEDAVQEILIRVVTRLASWRAEATLLTWAYRIGVNYLLNLRRKTPQEAFRHDLADGLAAADYAGPGPELLAEEVRLSCSQAMLQCLERAERVAFVLGEIFELSSTEAEWILDISPATYRKRLQRARQRIRAFMGSTCGLVNPEAFCRCARRVDTAVALGRVDPRRPALATHPVTPSGRGVADAAAQLHHLHDAAAVLRAPRLRRTAGHDRSDHDIAAVWAVPAAGVRVSTLDRSSRVRTPGSRRARCPRISVPSSPDRCPRGTSAPCRRRSA